MITFNQLVEATGKRVRYTFEEDGKQVYGSVVATTPRMVHVQWEDENTPTEYRLTDTLADLLRMEIMGNTPRTLTRSSIVKAIEDAVLIGADYGRNRFSIDTTLTKQKQLIEQLLG